MFRTRRTAALLTIAATATGVAASVAASPEATAVTTNGIHARSTVPWSKVGDGWTAAAVVKSGHKALVLVSPTGQSYRIATLAAGEEVASIAHDGKHVLTYYQTKSSYRMRVWDVRTGKVSTTLPSDVASADFTRPTGAALNTETNNETFRRVTVAGGNELSLAHHPGLWDILPHPGGLYDAGSALVDTPVTLYNHGTMRAIRTYTVPKGAKDCSAVGWADASTLLEACTMKQLGELNQIEVYKQNIKGGAPKALTVGGWPGDANQPFKQGFRDVDFTAVGTVATPSDSALTGGVTSVYVMKSGRVAKTIKAPLAADVAKNVDYTKVVGNTVIYTHMSPTAASTAVASYNLKTKKVTYLAGLHSQYGGKATSSAVIDPSY